MNSPTICTSRPLLGEQNLGPGAVAKWNPTRRTLQRRDRAAAVIPCHRLGGHSGQPPMDLDAPVLALLALCGLAAVLLAGL
jgi:hypothetical protein